jgi:cell division ATPase FtsA
VSFVFADKKFRSFVESTISKFGIGKTEFVSSCLAQAAYLFDDSRRSDVCCLIDVGFVTTSVSLFLGDGLLYSKSFSVGSGQIADDLAQVLEIDYEVADELRKKINLNLDFDAEDVYSVNGYSGKMGALKANDIVKARIEDMAETIRNCIKESGVSVTDSTPFYLSGGGLCYMRGGAKALSEYLGKKVELAPVISPELNQYDYNSSYGQIAVALRENKRFRSFFGKILDWIGG